MKGIIFREFLEMVESNFGYEMIDGMLNETKLKSDGIYTSVGTYDHKELIELVHALSRKTSLKIPELLKQYGIHVFSIFSKKYPTFFKDIHDAFTFLSNVEETIHVEVLKLYPEAELPTFIVEATHKDILTMEYNSERKLADFAEGLIIGCINYFNENIEIRRELIKKDKSSVKFILTKNK